jgi:hypothetical protein
MRIRNVNAEKIFICPISIKMSRSMMKRWGLFLLAVLLVSVVLTFMYGYYTIWNVSASDEFFFGVAFGHETVEEAKLLIDKVKNYTNFFVIASWAVSLNETALNEICDYAVQADLKFIVYFDLVSRITYPWHQEWLDTAKERWSDYFLGVYLRDEPGGKQIDLQETFENASDYNDASNRFVNGIASLTSTQDVKSRNIPMFTSDYALYWFDYLAGYDTIFVELGWNHNTPQHIGMGRGAANVQGKDWGVIITWTSYEEPYLGSKAEISQEMLAAYRAGAKYVVMFNYPTYPEDNPYGLLSEDHFTAMEEFWDYVHAYPRGNSGKVDGKVAFVLPKDYGWGLRNVEDKIWGLWAADEKAPLIWGNMNKLISRYGLELDIVYDDNRFNIGEKYSEVYFWNATID